MEEEKLKRREWKNELAFEVVSMFPLLLQILLASRFKKICLSFNCSVYLFLFFCI